MLNVTYKQLESAMRTKGYVWFTGPYDMNLIGVRNLDNRKDDFNDTLCLAYKDGNGYERIFCMPCTTDPGHYYLKNPLVSKGTAILTEGQHRGSHQLGIHKGYTALVQRIPLTVHRDANLDARLDFSKTEKGMFGINIHRAIQNSIAKTIGKFSAGCTVVQSPEDFAYLVSMIKRQKFQIGTDTVSYTIIREENIR